MFLWMRNHQDTSKFIENKLSLLKSFGKDDNGKYVIQREVVAALPEILPSVVEEIRTFKKDYGWSVGFNVKFNSFLLQFLLQLG